MPSFDVVSEVNLHEVTNALDQVNKELTNRYDLKNSGSDCRREDNVITITSDSDFHLKQVVEVMMAKFARRSVNLQSLKSDAPVASGRTVRQTVTIRRGIDAATGKKIVQAVKDAKLKIQASIHEEKVRVTGKKRDGLQAVIALLREADFDLPLQFINFRD